MKKIISFNVFIVITFAITICLGYILLVQDNNLNTSIAAIFAKAHNLELKEHLIVLGLLPIYIATVIFGSTAIGVYIGSQAQQLVQYFLFNKKR